MLLKRLNTPAMTKLLMNTDERHRPTFIRWGNAAPSEEQAQPKQGFSWAKLIELCLTLAVIAGVGYLLARLVTPEVVTVAGILVGFLVLRFVVRTILKIAFTLLSVLFWLAVLGAILLCVL